MSLELHKKGLLHYLSLHSSVRYGELMEKLNLSKRSVKLLIESLLYSYDHIFSIDEDGETVCLRVLDSSSFCCLVTEELLLSSDFNSFHKRQAVCLQTLLDATDYVSAEYLAEVVGVSRRSLGRDLLRIKKLVKDYQLDLESKPGVGLKLNGQELHKRLLYLYEVFAYVPCPLELPKELEETYVDFISHQHFPLDVERSFLLTLKLTLLRKEYTLQDEDMYWFTMQSDLDIPPLFYEVLTYFLGRPLTEGERKFLTFPMQIGLVPSDGERADLLESTREILQLLIEEFGIGLDVEESAHILQRHLLYMLNRGVMKWQFTEISLREQLVESLFSKFLAQFVVDHLGQKTSLELSSKEVVLLAAWMELLLARKSKPLISRIAVITQSGTSFRYLIEQQIQHIFSREVQLDFFDFVNHPPYEELNTRYELIFTDNLLYSQELFQPFLSLSLLTKENQAERIALEQTVLGRTIQMHCRVKRVELDVSVSYEENLETILGNLVKEGIFSDLVAQKLREKEKRSPALSEDGYAFPHLTDAGLEQIVLVVASQDSFSLSSQTGLSVRDFILLGVPSELDDFSQNVLFNIFDRTFRMTDHTRIKDRLGLAPTSGGG